MIELQTSNELYSLLSEIRRRGLLMYMNNECMYFEDSLLGSCGPNEEMISYVLGYIWNIPNPEHIFIEKKLLLTVNLKFISSLDKSIMDSVRISHHPNWNSIKDEKCYMLIYDVYSNPKVVPFRSEATSIGMK